MKTWEKLKSDPSLWQQYFVREQVIHAVREYFAANSFHEVETPLLVGKLPAESHLEIFSTTLLNRQRAKTPAYLLTSPELPLKKLIAAGIGNCYAITKSFRNMETQSSLHNPEFTMLEWYHVGVSYEEVMKDCENLLRFVTQQVIGKPEIRYKGLLIDLTTEWERISVAESFVRYAEIDFEAFMDVEGAKAIAAGKGYSVEPQTTWEQLFHQIFLNEVEPHLGKEKPTILYEFPSTMAALAQKKSSDARFSERFEFYIAGLELGDCYGELTDPVEQKKRFDSEMDRIKHSGNTVYPYDTDFLAALSSGMPTTSGIAVGLDRLIMLIAGVDDIADTMFFPVKDLFD